MLVSQHRGNAAASFSWSLTANFALFVYVVKRSTVLLLALDFSGHVCVFFFAMSLSHNVVYAAQ